jgi:hypothetical protein
VSRLNCSVYGDQQNSNTGKNPDDPDVGLGDQMPELVGDLKKTKQQSDIFVLQLPFHPQTKNSKRI